MKQSIFYLVPVLLLVAGCQQMAEEEIVTPAPEAAMPQRTITATLEGHTPTRTELSGPDENGIYYPWWSDGDEVAVWADGVNVSDKYTLSDGAGSGTATFKGTLYGKKMVALYPYADKTADGVEGDVLSLGLPSEQTYVAGSFGPGAFPMVSVSESDAFSFRNLCAVLKVSMTGEESVNSIRFIAHDEGMPVSGRATVRTDFESDPVLEMESGGSAEVTLFCGFVTLDSATPTDFYLVIPAGTYKGGFTLEIKTFAGTVTRSTTADITFARSQFRAIPCFECVGTGEIDTDNLPYNQIWYATSTGRTISVSTSRFNAGLVSNVYENGWGILTFDAPVTELGAYALYNSLLTDVILPNCVESLGNYALAGSDFSAFRTPDALKTVGRLAFQNCRSTVFSGKWATEDGKAVILEDGTMVAYADGSTEETLEIPYDGVLSLQEYLFYYRDNLRSAILPEGLTSVGAYCFYGTGLETIYIPDSVESIGSRAFAGCTSLREFTGPNEMILDGRALAKNGSMFAYAGKGMAEYVIPDEVTEIQSEVFNNWEDLHSLTFPPNLENLYSGFVTNCPNLEFFYGTGASEDRHCLVLYGEYLVAVTSITPSDYTVPDNVQRVFVNVFSGNECIESLTLPDGIWFLHYYALGGMPNVKTIRMPSALTQIAGYPFSGDTSLETIYMRSYAPPSFSDSEGDWGAENLVIYVPNGFEDVYKSTDGWSAYADKIQGYIYDDLEAPDYYISSDYSQDGAVSVYQQATEGNGIDLVFMGDAFSDRQVEDGTYAAVMDKMVEAFFSEEPYATYRDLFNVTVVTVVSATEGYEHAGQALGGWFGSGTQVGGNDSKVMEYAQAALPELDTDNALVIVAMNSTAYAGTCYMYYPSDGDYGCGLSVAYFPVGESDEGLAQLVHHEAGGHGFAKLADEYAYESMGAIPQSEIDSRLANVPYGWWKNCDFTNDTAEVKWSYFLSDARYQWDGLGCYEGGFTYWSGVWRPTENSIMRYNTGGYNAPSREAIWYRIHKLAYGADWEEDFEEFVSYDAVNRQTSSSTSSRPSRVLRQTPPLHAPVVVGRRWNDPEPLVPVRNSRRGGAEPAPGIDRPISTLEMR